jgi:hypothetical protein
MAVDHIKNLRALRDILRKQPRKLIATMVGAKKETTKFAPLKRFPTDLNRWDSQKVRDERVFGH